MEQARWDEINRLLGEALERPPSERRAWVDKACAGDVELRRSVEDLLDAYDGAGPFLETPPHELAQRTLADALPRIGPYRPERTLGHGGMGTVYLAARADGRFERQVALKVLHPGLDSEPLLRRFAQEQQVLAALNHPHIARLYNAGLTEEGRPYLAMEYVEGRLIDCHCDDERLSTEERLRLFTAVAEAVQHAHRNLVVHRDLKPANVLVTPEGAPKLLDFGIAKLLREAEMEGETAPLTRTGERWMTPEYAAPEQVRGEAISTATDVYALGVLLYKLLTGRRPFRLEGRTPGEVEHAICEEAPTRPSTVVTATDGNASDEEDSSAEAIGRARRTTPKRLRRRLKGDLDTILLKALRKEPERRYASAEAFVEDIKRHLAGLPVKARPDTASYRAHKFVRRHRWGVGAAAALVLLVGAFTLFYTWRVTEERDRAQAEAVKAERVTAFLAGLFEEADPYRTEAGPHREAALAVLASVAERIDRELENEPAVRAQLLHALGTIYQKLGRPDRAGPMLRRALALRRSLYGEGPHEEVAASLHTYGTFIASQHPDSAAAYFREAAQMRRTLFEGDHPDLAESLLQQARFLPYDDPAKQPLFKDAIAMRTRLHGPRSVEVADAIYSFYVLGYGGRTHEEVEQGFRRALSIYRERLGEEHIHTAEVMHDLGLILDGAGRPAEGMRLLRRSYEIARSSAGLDQLNASLMAINVGATLHERGRYREADTLFREALAIRRESLPEGSKPIAYALYWHGRNLMALQKTEKAEARLREALEIYEGSPSGWSMWRVQRELGACLAATGRYAEAEPLLLESYTRFRQEYGLQHRHTRRTLHRLTDFYNAWGKPDEAARYRDTLAVASDGEEP